MQVIIEEVVSRIKATNSEAALSPQALNTVVTAVMEAIAAQDQRGADQEEERSLQNYQERVRPGR
ncbi:hypothetical protein [Tateyamaria omphalii]|nr:hypothetical protein [Tateyamaria omphalii]